MGKVRQFEIVFDGGVNLFSYGDVIQGHVTLQVDTEGGEGLKNVKGIWVRFQGKAKTKWKTGSGENTSTHTQKECYFDDSLVVFGTGLDRHDVGALNLPSGMSSFPFRFSLSAGPLPSPFEGKYGYVRYRAKATMSLIRTFINKTFKVEQLFSIVGPTVDLNADSRNKMPMQAVTEHMGCCGCGSNAETIVTVGLPKRGYVAGEAIHALGSVDNRDGEEFGSFQARLTQYVTFHSRNHTKVKKYVLATANGRIACPKGQVTNFTLPPLQVPPVPPSGLPGCNIIDIQYIVKIESSLCDQKFSIVVGTVPLLLDTMATAPLESSGIVTEFTQDYPISPSAPPSYAELPPPSYADAVGVIDRFTDERDQDVYLSQNQFVPQYPYFDLTVDVPSSNRP